MTKKLFSVLLLTLGFMLIGEVKAKGGIERAKRLFRVQTGAPRKVRLALPKEFKDEFLSLKKQLVNTGELTQKCLEQEMIALERMNERPQELKSRAKTGDAEAQYQWALYLFFGMQDSPDNDSNLEGAIFWLEQAANQGHRKAQLVSKACLYYTLLENRAKECQSPDRTDRDFELFQKNMQRLETYLADFNRISEKNEEKMVAAPEKDEKEI